MPNSATSAAVMAGGVAEPLLQALRALLDAAPNPQGIFDAHGACLVANRDFVIRAAETGQGHAPTTGQTIRTEFTPDGANTLTLVTVTDEGPNRPVQSFIDTVANALPVMFNAKDRQSTYLFMNRYQAELYGITPEGAVGRTAADFLGDEYGRYTAAIDADVIRTAQPTPFYEESITATDGLPRRWLTSKVPLIGDDAKVWGVATVSVDITERTRLEEGLRQAKEQAEAANRAKSGFLAAMSHELRTPLNAVIGFAEIMHQQALGPIGSPDYADYAGHIMRSGQHLLSLINDVLDYARIESNSLRLNISPVDLRAVVRATLDVLEQTATAAGVTLATELPDHRIVIQADEQRLRQVLLNVAGNAVKFTPSGGRVAVTLRQGENGGAIITVTDSGVGIADENMPYVFEPFWQADSGLDRLKEGAGIGLPLARQLIALHGGQLALESRPGEGTSVTVTLPERNETVVG